MKNVKNKKLRQVFLSMTIQAERIYTLFKRAIVSFSFRKTWRKTLHAYLSFPLISFFNVKEMFEYDEKNDHSFYNYTIRKNSVLIVEPNHYHAVTLPGLVKYFQDSGYSVDLFMRPVIYNEDVFYRVPENQMPRIFTGTSKHLKKLLRLLKIREYDFVFFSSAIIIAGFLMPYTKYLGFEPKAKYGVLMIEHGVTDISEFNQQRYEEEDRVFALWEFFFNNQKLKMIHPHYFGDVRMTPKSVKKTRFIVVGGIKERCKNHDLLLRTVERLVHNRVTNFEVIVIGPGELLVPDNLRDYIIFKGFLNFPDMFEEIEQADFFLSLLDPTNRYHKKYMHSRTTGSMLLVHGLLKPTLINEIFAKVYNLSEKNSIIYPENNVYYAMIEAIELSPSNYTKMQNNLKQLSDNIMEISLKNLAETIETHKKQRTPYKR